MCVCVCVYNICACNIYESMTRKETEMQKLVQVVKHHRKCLSACSKATLMMNSTLQHCDATDT